MCLSFSPRIALLTIPPLVLGSVGCERVAETAVASPDRPKVDVPSEPTPMAEMETHTVPVSQATGTVQLSEAAAEQVLRIVREKALPTGTHLRVRVKGGGCSGFLYDLGFDAEVRPEEDIVFDSQQVAMVVDRKSMLFLDGTTIDFVTMPDGRRGFVFENPNAANATCPTDRDQTAESAAVEKRASADW